MGEDLAEFDGVPPWIDTWMDDIYSQDFTDKMHRVWFSFIIRVYRIDWWKRRVMGPRS